ncbi:MAG: hypothetical protein M1818_008090 [Claussenomyces sp. TS43310]|nr:MAG: hypothetical protein M1818_008090 [Claussenomyces sp. TS43310]
MSLARAFTTRRTGKPQISGPMPERSLTTKRSFPTGTLRHKISAPVELISTTNMLSYNAPDLYPLSASSSSSSKSISDNETEATSVSTAPTSPDHSGDEISPNHLSCYFGEPDSSRGSTSSAACGVPVIPSRSPSHTKRTHEIVHRHRSLSRMSSRSKNSGANVTRDSLQMFSPTVEMTEPADPFEKELSQVSEMVEELGSSLMVIDEEEQELLSRGFFKYTADDYMSEISGLFMSTFVDRPIMAAQWI